MTDIKKSPRTSANARGAPKSDLLTDGFDILQNDFHPQQNLAERQAAQRRARARKQRLANAKARPPLMDAPPRDTVALTMSEFRRLHKPELWARLSVKERRRRWRFYSWLRDVRPIQDVPSARELARLSGASNVFFLEHYTVPGRRA
jgi:hypothetical protein